MSHKPSSCVDPLLTGFKQAFFVSKELLYIWNTTAQTGLPSQTACDFVDRLMPCKSKNLGKINKLIILRKRRRPVCAVFSWDNNHCTKHLKNWTYFWNGKLRAFKRSCLRFFSRFCMTRLRARCSLVFIGQLENEDIILLLKNNVGCSLY